METYRQQVEELGRRLGLLQTENESLEKRNRLLEKVVQMKDQKPKQNSTQPPQVSYTRMRFALIKGVHIVQHQ